MQRHKSSSHALEKWIHISVMTTSHTGIQKTDLILLGRIMWRTSEATALDKGKWSRSYRGGLVSNEVVVNYWYLWHILKCGNKCAGILLRPSTIDGSTETEVPSERQEAELEVAELKMLRFSVGVTKIKSDREVMWSWAGRQGWAGFWTCVEERKWKRLRPQRRSLDVVKDKEVLDVTVERQRNCCGGNWSRTKISEWRKLNYCLFRSVMYQRLVCSHYVCVLPSFHKSDTIES